MFGHLTNVLRDYGIKVDVAKEPIIAVCTAPTLFNGTEKQLNVYPSMLVQSEEKNVIFVSDFELKYAKAYAVDKIKSAIGV